MQSVNDVTGNNEGLESGIHNYTYDEIGNLTSDKDIQEINWTVYGKIASVKKRDNTEIEYKYDGTGQRIYKKVVSSSVSKETHYVRDGSGNVLAIYENKILDELVIYGSSRLGSYNGKTDNGKRTLGNKKYELSNHLGNVLAVISDNKIGIGTNGVADYYEPLVISESNYYPFGMAMKERSFSNEEYRFGFNTQEKSTELGEDTYTAEFWQYDSKIARRWNNDPRPNTSISVYAAFAGNPILVSDHFGDTTRYYNSSGEKIGQINDELENSITFITDDNLAAFTRDYSFYKSLNEGLQESSRNYFAYTLSQDGISYMSENLFSNLSKPNYTFGSHYDMHNIMFPLSSIEQKGIEPTSATLKDLQQGNVDFFYLPNERGGYTYLDDGEVRTHRSFYGSSFKSITWNYLPSPLSDKALWSSFHIHPVEEHRVGTTVLWFFTTDPNARFHKKTAFLNQYSSSSSDQRLSVANPSIGKFDVIATWEKGGTLIFYGNDDKIQYKVHLYK